MLKKLISIKNVGNFRDHAASGPTDFERLTLIHADNGRGKTTLCALLRSLRNDEPFRIEERRTLDGVGPTYVKLLFDGGTVIEFKDGAWASARPDLEIFDADFVTDNVFSGDSITHEHKRNLCRVVLGAEGVTLAKRLEELVVAERDASAELTTARGRVASLAPAWMSPDEYSSLLNDPDLDFKVAAARRDLLAAEQSAQIATASKLSEIGLPTLADDLKRLLATTLVGLSTAATRAVHQHISEHLTEIRDPESWLNSGVDASTEGLCPLCAQPLEDSPIFAALREYFSQSYRRFYDELCTAAHSVRRNLSAEVLLPIHATVSGNDREWSFWKDFFDATDPAFSLDRLNSAMESLRQAAEPLIAQKVASPLDPVAETDGLHDALREYASVLGDVERYCDEVRALNSAIDGRKKTASRTEAPVLRKTLATFEAQKARHMPGPAGTVDAYIRSQGAKAAIEKEKKQARSDLETHNAKVVGTYRVAVNDLLARFGAGFALRDVRVEHTGGGGPRAAFTFEIRGIEVDPGGDSTKPGMPCFRNTLSAGDRNTLALALFVAQLLHRTDLDDLIVVFDDPFTSLDTFRRHQTCSTIRRIAAKAKQVIVCSHSIEFLEMVADKYQLPFRSLQIARQNAVDSHVTAHDLDAATATLIEKDVARLEDYHNGDVSDAESVIGRIRPLLENYIRSVAPKECAAEKLWLGGMLKMIAEADSSSRLCALKDRYELVDELNNYTSQFHHDSGLCPAIDHTELLTHVKLTLKVVRPSAVP